MSPSLSPSIRLWNVDIPAWLSLAYLSNFFSKKSLPGLPFCWGKERIQNGFCLIFCLTYYEQCFSFLRYLPLTPSWVFSWEVGWADGMLMLVVRPMVSPSSLARSLLQQVPFLLAGVFSPSSIFVLLSASLSDCCAFSPHSYADTAPQQFCEYGSITQVSPEEGVFPFLVLLAQVCIPRR